VRLERVPAADDQQPVDPVIFQPAADAVQVVDGRDLPADPEFGAAAAGPALDVTPLQLADVTVDEATEAVADAEHGVPPVQPQADRRVHRGVHPRGQAADVQHRDPG